MSTLTRRDILKTTALGAPLMLAGSAFGQAETVSNVPPQHDEDSKAVVSLFNATEWAIDLVVNGERALEGLDPGKGVPPQLLVPGTYDFSYVPSGKPLSSGDVSTVTLQPKQAYTLGATWGQDDIGVTLLSDPLFRYATEPWARVSVANFFPQTLTAVDCPHFPTRAPKQPILNVPFGMESKFRSLDILDDNPWQSSKYQAWEQGKSQPLVESPLSLFQRGTANRVWITRDGDGNPLMNVQGLDTFFGELVFGNFLPVPASYFVREGFTWKMLATVDPFEFSDLLRLTPNLYEMGIGPANANSPSTRLFVPVTTGTSGFFVEGFGENELANGAGFNVGQVQMLIENATKELVDLTTTLPDEGEAKFKLVDNRDDGFLKEVQVDGTVVAELPAAQSRVPHFNQLLPNTKPPETPPSSTGYIPLMMGEHTLRVRSVLPLLNGRRYVVHEGALPMLGNLPTVGKLFRSGGLRTREIETTVILTKAVVINSLQ